AKPVAILGLSGVPQAGDVFYAVEDEKKLREVVESRKASTRQKSMVEFQRVRLEDLHDLIQAGSIKELRLVVKADVQGSLEALVSDLSRLSNDQIRMTILHKGVGQINDSDVILADVSGALLIGFGTTLTNEAEALAKEKQVDVQIYNIIYEATAAIHAALEGLLEPMIEETIHGRAEVLQIFKITKVGKVAGCMVTSGKIFRGSKVRVIRNDEVIYTSKLRNLKRFKDEVKEVFEGTECGMSVEGFANLNAGDILEVFDTRKVARKLVS
ncbi:MAG: translation initiation factor IF-2, partial [Candidatus Omnitrophica bacterium]|nr:translation initiation factor IF-2 [Candidatus Omnitrophota bacterium]